MLTDALHEVMPGADVAGVDPDGLLQEELDIDSLGFLGVLTEISERAGIDIPERAYPELVTFRSFVAYLATVGGGVRVDAGAATGVEGAPEPVVTGDRTIALTGGRTMVVRPTTPDDVDGLTRLYAGLSDGRPPPPLLRHLSPADGVLRTPGVGRRERARIRPGGGDR